VLLECRPGFEAHPAACRDLQGFARRRVASVSCGSIACLECSDPAKMTFSPVAVAAMI